MDEGRVLGLRHLEKFLRRLGGMRARRLAFNRTFKDLLTRGIESKDIEPGEVCIMITYYMRYSSSITYEW